MKKINTAICLSILLLSSCGAIKSTSEVDRHKMEMAVNKLRTEIEEIKHDLNTYHIEHHVLDGKLVDQQEMIAKLESKDAKIEQIQIDKLKKSLEFMKKKQATLSKTQEKIATEIRKLSTHTTDTNFALSQNKKRLSELEKNLLMQNKSLAKLEKITSAPILYVVQDGDSLEKIAKKFSTTIEQIKKLNKLENDLIKIGQKINVPSNA